jgi:hypothetical protein
MPRGSAAVLLVPELEPIPRLELAIKHRGERPDRHDRKRSPSQDSRQTAVIRSRVLALESPGQVRDQASSISA